ncbi:MAG: tRNA (guanosine(37)-N1)-methyltransferase TrmD [Oscillospiraceae bacterium]|nr:tRNA (guanosine(37)-N1)-methyltransferase TrmD [Oscillospiraceae bacterium]
MYTIDILTLFPDAVESVLSGSITGRARERGIIDFRAWQIRDFTKNKQKQTDDYPYGGGRGCVMYAQPLADCRRAVCDSAGRESIHTICLSPAGRPFTQDIAKRLSREHDRIILVCGHYEGIDERFIDACVDEEISLGDFVLTGGEIPALAVADAVFRLVPGVLPDEECVTDESHWDGLLEHPQYTRPELWEGRAVPELLLSGHHLNIKKWRRAMSLLRTRARRPDMFERLSLSDEDLKLLREFGS